MLDDTGMPATEESHNSVDSNDVHREGDACKVVWVMPCSVDAATWGSSCSCGSTLRAKSEGALGIHLPSIIETGIHRLSIITREIPILQDCRNGWQTGLRLLDEVWRCECQPIIEARLAWR